MRVFILSLAVIGAVSGASIGAAEKEKPPQYKFEKIIIAAASESEPVQTPFSRKAAMQYLEDGAAAWSGQRKCVSCHTNGAYMTIRPSLTRTLGPPSKELHAFFVQQLQKKQKTDVKILKEGLRPTQLAYIAAGLAEWDLYVAGKLSKETDAALRLMLSLQSKDGSFSNLDCWPPYESSNYHGATVAAMAVARAPGWLRSLNEKEKKDKPVIQQVARLKSYLKKTKPPHDYGRVLLLWTSTRMDGLIDRQRQRKLMDMLMSHQRDDGGWSIRTFARPDKWGRGNRAEKLRKELNFFNPPSDGHMTGLAVLVLREAGVPARDPRIQKAVKWLKNNQRQSGRWWTRSLNTDRYHFITYTGTLFPMAALAKCGEMEK